MQTIFEFTLPRGYTDGNGELHRTGQMRLATASDEITSLQDPRVQANEAYLPVVLLSKVIVQLGSLRPVPPQVVEQFFATDFAYLEDFYEHLNTHEEVILGTVCPHCSGQFQVQIAPLG